MPLTGVLGMMPLPGVLGEVLVWSQEGLIGSCGDLHGRMGSLVRPLVWSRAPLHPPPQPCECHDTCSGLGLGPNATVIFPAKALGTPISPLTLTLPPPQGEADNISQHQAVHLIHSRSGRERVSLGLGSGLRGERLSKLRVMVMSLVSTPIPVLTDR